jgi:hypothetical protein
MGADRAWGSIRGAVTLGGTADTKSDRANPIMEPPFTAACSLQHSPPIGLDYSS